MAHWMTTQNNADGSISLIKNPLVDDRDFHLLLACWKHDFEQVMNNPCLGKGISIAKCSKPGCDPNVPCGDRSAIMNAKWFEPTRQIYFGDNIPLTDQDRERIYND